MMISDAMAASLNEQIKHEHYSSYLYLSMSYALEQMNYRVFAQWFTLQAEEEDAHALKMARYLIEQGAPVRLEAIDQPPAEFCSVLEIVQAALDHEKLITRRIHDISKQAREGNDPATESFLQWFVTEQVEEVDSVNELLEVVRMAENPAQLLLLEDSRVSRMVSERQTTSQSA